MSASSHPEVSIILPVFNGQEHLPISIASMLQQSFDQFELILIDNASTDASADIARAFAAKDRRIRLILRDQNLGMVASLNEGVLAARGDWIARMDADDVAHPRRLEKQRAYMLLHPEVDLVGSRVLVIDSANQLLGTRPSPLTHKEICSRPWAGFYMGHPTFFGKTQWFRKFMYHVPPFFRCEDQDILLRSHSESRFATVDEYLLAYRTGPSTSYKTLFQTRLACLQSQMKYFSSRKEYQNLAKASVTCCARLVLDAKNVILSSANFQPLHDNTILDASPNWWQDRKLIDASLIEIKQ